MDETIVNRLLILMEAYGFSAGAFADKIEVQRSSISHLMSGRNKPSLDFIQKVLLQFPDINPSWLIMGKGPMKQLNLFDEVGKVAEPAPLPPTIASKFENSPEPIEYSKEAPIVKDKASLALEETIQAIHTPVVTIEPTPNTIAPPQAPVQVHIPTTTSETIPVPDVSVPVTQPTPSVATPSNAPTTKKAVKIVFFYDDNTFETFYPGN
jgi:hypothetical protein